MSISKVKASSRPFGVAESLIGVQIDRDAVLRRAVVLTGERETLLTENGRWCLMDCIRLLPRIVGQLTIWLPPGLGALEDEVRYAATTVWGNGSVVLALDDTEVGIADAAAVLNVGSGVRPDLRWTAVNSNGWVARVTSGNQPLPSDVNQANPVAALMAASLGVTEVFKRIYGVPPDVAPLLDLTEFSLYELTTSPKGIGPRLPADVNLPDTVLVGAGAIGNGIALLLSQLRVRCRLHVIDKQAYADENLGTCILLDDVTWLGNSKAERLAKWLRTHSSTEVTGEQALVSEARAGDAVKSMAVDLVLNGLDDVQARHDAQMLWPSVLVDGGINAVGAAVVTHRLDRPGWACMRCGFRLPTTNERDVQSAATGLSHSSLLMDYGRMLTDADVEQAVEAKRPWLREKVKESEKRLIAKRGLIPHPEAKGWPQKDPRDLSIKP